MKEVIPLKRIILVFVLGLGAITLTGCGTYGTRQESLSNHRTVIINVSGMIVSGGGLEPLEGYIYDEKTGRNIIKTTGIGRETHSIGCKRKWIPVQVSYAFDRQ